MRTISNPRITAMNNKIKDNIKNYNNKLNKAKVLEDKINSDEDLKYFISKAWGNINKPSEPKPIITGTNIGGTI